MAKQNTNESNKDFCSVDEISSMRKWILQTTAKIALLPLILVVLITAYLLFNQSQLSVQSGQSVDIPLSDVELVAGVLGSLTEHHRLTVDNLGKSSVGNAWMTLQKSSKKEAALRYSEQLSQLDISSKGSTSWSKAIQLVNNYVASHVDTSDQIALDTADSSAEKMTKAYTKVHAGLIGLLKAPSAETDAAATDVEDSTNSAVSPFTQANFIVAALMGLLILAVFGSAYFGVRSIYKHLGGTPEHLQSVAHSLSNDVNTFKLINFGSDYFGLMDTLHEIGVKLEEHRAGKRLAKQINGRLGHSEHNVASDDHQESVGEVSASVENENLESSTDSIQNDINSTGDAISKQKPHSENESNQAVKDELEALLSANAENESRIDAVLQMAKHISDGDLTKKSGVTGEDRIGQIAHYQDLNVEALKNRLTIFGNQSGSLKVSSQSLIEMNDHMIHSSLQTAEQAELVSSSAEEISQNVDSVALAVKEMSASIREISEHTAEAAQVAEHAVVLASDTDATVRKLSESSTAIDAVIKVINSIAEQTNLLALNATIEAARAGDAGKGFAVVANEVKELAKETARATEEIAQQIATIQSDSHDAVTVIGDISKIIDRVNEIQSTIAAAVEEQSVTTAEINRSINDVSHGSSQIAKNVSDVAETAKENKDSVETAKETVETIINVSNDLDEMLAGYNLSSGKKRRKAA